jgi:hypothetical protein
MEPLLELSLLLGDSLLGNSLLLGLNHRKLFLSLSPLCYLDCVTNGVNLFQRIEVFPFILFTQELFDQV